MNFVAIDFETANTRSNSACALGLIRVENGQITQQKSWLIRPPTSEFLFTHIHGIRWEDVENRDSFGRLWPEISRYFENTDFITAHNVGFDRSILQGCARTYEFDPPELPYQCSMILARKRWGIYPTKLPDVCQKLGISLKHHDALSDAMACAQIWLRSIEQPKLDTLQNVEHSE